MGSQLPTNLGSPNAGPPPVSPSTWAPPTLSLGDDSPPVNWRRYIAAVLRYKWLILLVTLAGGGIGVFATRYLRPRYVAQAAVWIRAGNQGDRGPIQSAQLLRSQAWVELLRSYEVMDSVVLALGLYVQPVDWTDGPLLTGFALADRFRTGEYRLRVRAGGAGYALLTREGVVLEQGAVGDTVGLASGFNWVPAPEVWAREREIRFTVVPPRDAARQLQQDLQIGIDRDANFLRLQLEGVDAAGITGILNAVVERYVEVAASLKREQLTAKRQILEEQLAIAAQNVTDAEQALEEFRVRTITLPSEPGTPVAPGLAETRDPVFLNFFSMQVDRDALQRDRQAVERTLREAAADTLGGASLDALNVIGAVQQSTELRGALTELMDKQAELRSLRYSYTEEHPRVQRTLQELRHLQREEIPALGRSLLAELTTRGAALDDRITTASRELQAIPTRAITEGRLRRDLTIAATLYADLQARYSEARFAEASSFPDVSVLDRAVTPQTPVSNDKMRLILLAIVAGLAAGLGAAVLLDRFDRRVRYPEQVTDDLGLSILGAITHVRDSGRRAAQDQSQLVEALRGIRLGLTHAYGAAGPLVVTVTSPGSGDGKSFLSRHLAIAYAEAGHRTLLIDGDTRRGELHRPIGMRRKPGLTGYLRGSVPREALIQETDQPGLHFIGAGTRMHDGPELLASPAMAQLILSLRSSFGVIVVDSPPLSAGVDPFVLGSVTGALLLVLRTGLTDRALAEAKLETLGRLPIRVLGAVLNDIRPNGQYRYYAYQYYSEGYETRDEDVEPVNVGAGRLIEGA